ncbi:MAG: hypothetical protein M3336_12845 [Chloroflexota bacterium]|nr:hypothetical protein [Chloroflexota bacterium]
MDVPVLVVVVVVVVIVAAAAVWYMQRQQRTKQLRQQFGPEYGRAVEQLGEPGRAESALRAREERVRQLHIRPLTPDAAERFAGSWRSVQARFVDDPQGAIGDADRLVAEVMAARGYPMGDFEQRAADVSVDHADVVEHYRAAHAIASRQDGQSGNTEELRQAMVHYRALFHDLLETDPAQQTTEVRRG